MCADLPSRPDLIKSTVFLFAVYAVEMATSLQMLLPLDLK